MKVFLTGATGYVGTRVAEKLLGAGHDVTGLARSEEGAAKLRERGVVPVMGDLKQPETLIAPAQNADGVIHCGFVHDFSDYEGMMATERGALSMFTNTLADSGKPFVSTQAIGYLQDTGAAPVDETWPINREGMFSMRAEMEDRSLQMAERGIRASVLRLPPCVYGHGGKGFVSMMLDAAQQNGASYCIEPGNCLQSTVHVDDLADLYLLALQNAPAGSVYNATLEPNIMARDLAQAIADNIGAPLKMIAPDQATSVFGPMLGVILTLVLTKNTNTTGAKAERELGWRKKSPVTFLDDIARGSYKA